jgi:hypothetical protein
LDGCVVDVVVDVAEPFPRLKTNVTVAPLGTEAGFVCES